MAGEIAPQEQEIVYETIHFRDNKGPAIVGGSILLIVFATIAVVLRLVARRIKRTAWGADDYTIVVSLTFAYGMFISIMYCARYGLGKHILRVGLASASKMGKALYVLEAIYPACTAATKISILLLYRRVFTTLNPYFRYCLYIISIVLVGWAISGFFTTVFQCTPIHKIWEGGGEGECIDLVPALIALAVINTVVNAAVLILPMPIVWYLNMPRRRKVAICGIFVIGSGDVISSIVRTALTSQLKTTDVDLTWLEADAAMLAFVEPCLGIICACLPTMRPVFGKPFIGSISSIFSSKHSVKDSQRDGSTNPASEHRPSVGYPVRLRPEEGWMELQERDAVEQMGAVKGFRASERGVDVEKGRGSTMRGDLEGFHEGGYQSPNILTPTASITSIRQAVVQELQPVAQSRMAFQLYRKGLFQVSRAFWNRCAGLNLQQRKPKLIKGDKVHLQNKTAGSSRTHGALSADSLRIHDTRLDIDGNWEYSLRTSDGRLYNRGEYYLEADLGLGFKFGPPLHPRRNKRRLLNLSGRGDVEAVRHTLDDELGFNIQQDILDRALKSACSERHAAIVELLLKKGAYANAQNAFGNSVLRKASESGHVAIVRILLAAGADVNAQNGNFTSALQAASACGHEAVVRILLGAGAIVNAQDESNDSALQAASTNGHEAVVRILLEAGAVVNAQDESNDSALQAASTNGHEAVVRILLEAGAVVDAQDEKYDSALQSASAHGHEAVVRLLLEAGAAVDAQTGFYGSALQAASANGHEAVVRILLEAGAVIDAQNRTYDSALQAASANRHETVVQQLLQAGAVVNAHTGFYGSALQAASANNHGAIVTRLLNAGADPNAQSGHYSTALQAASANGHVAVVGALLEAGTDPNASGGQYGSALQAASTNQHELIVQFLLSRDKSSVISPASNMASFSFYEPMRTGVPASITPNTQETERQVHELILQEEVVQGDNLDHISYRPMETDPPSIEHNANKGKTSKSNTVLDVPPTGIPRYSDEDGKSFTLENAPMDDAQNGNQRDEFSPTRTVAQNQNAFYESLERLGRQIFEWGSTALGKIEERNGFDFLPLPIIGRPARRSSSDSELDELRPQLERNLTIMSAILNGIDALTKERICNSIYNIIVVDPERGNVLRVVTLTTPNLDLLRDLLDEAVAYCDTPVQKSQLMETLVDIGTATVKILDYMGLWTSSLDLPTASNHQDCMSLCKSLSSLCSILFLGLISFIKSHLSESDVTQKGVSELQIETLHQPVLMSPRHLACLDSFVRDSVWSFSVASETPHSQYVSVERYYLSTLIGDFANLWGPLKLAYLDTEQNLLAEIQVPGGVIRKSDGSPQSPREQEDEVLCHFYASLKEKFNREADQASSISSTCRLLIGTPHNANNQKQHNPFEVHDECKCQARTSYSSTYPTIELNTRPPSWKDDTRTRQLGGGHYVTVAFSAGQKLDPGIRLRDAILKHWYDPTLATAEVIPQFSEPCYLDYLVVLEISSCTGHTRRTSLWTILGNPALRHAVGIRLGGNSESDLETVMRRDDNRAFVDVWKGLSGEEKLLIRKFMTLILQNLGGTGVQQDSLLAWDISSSSNGPGGKELSPRWRSMIKDNDQCATFAIITDQCIQYKSADKGFSPSKPREVLLTKICISTDYKLKINQLRMDGPKAHHGLRIDHHHSTDLRPPTDTLRSEHTNVIRKRLQQAGPNLTSQRERHRGRTVSSIGTAEARQVSPIFCSTSAHRLTTEQCTRGTYTRNSSPGSGFASDLGTITSPVRTRNVGEEIWCPVSLHFRNGMGQLRLEAPKHIMRDYRTRRASGTVPQFNLSEGSEAEFIGAEWNEYANNLLNALDKQIDNLAEKASTWLRRTATKVPWNFTAPESRDANESPFNVVEQHMQEL
ncbi:MAG: hypothetical protein LQ347_004750 [Umbilicaria vellea]|nr:MAG: hypothetical protein LQ347_004750 [Umbilicaria vellea]